MTIVCFSRQIYPAYWSDVPSPTGCLISNTLLEKIWWSINHLSMQNKSKGKGILQVNPNWVVQYQTLKISFFSFCWTFSIHSFFNPLTSFVAFPSKQITATKKYRKKYCPQTEWIYTEWRWEGTRSHKRSHSVVKMSIKINFSS